MSDRMTDEEREAGEATRERRKKISETGKHVEPKKQTESQKTKQ